MDDNWQTLCIIDQKKALEKNDKCSLFQSRIDYCQSAPHATASLSWDSDDIEPGPQSCFVRKKTCFPHFLAFWFLTTLSV